LKPFFPAVVAMVVGIVLGAWQPRGEMLALRAEVDALKLAGAAPCRNSAARSIRSILRSDAPDLGMDENGRRTASAQDPTPAPDADGPAPLEGGPEAPEGPDSPRSTEEMREVMQAGLDARRAQALAALVEQGDLGDDDVEAVNAAMDDMNRALKAEVDAFAEAALADGEVDRRDLMDFAAESLDIVIAADEQLRRALPEDVYGAVDDSAVDPFSYVSGDTLDALTRLEGVSAPMLDR